MHFRLDHIVRTVTVILAIIFVGLYVKQTHEIEIYHAQCDNVCLPNKWLNSADTFDKRTNKSILICLCAADNEDKMEIKIKK